MRILFIGGTGFISTTVSRQVVALGHELFLLNRGQRGGNAAGAASWWRTSARRRRCARPLGGLTFDVIVDWIAYAPQDIERDLALFGGLTRQFVFISSASIYQKAAGALRHHGIDAAVQSVLGIFAEQDCVRGAADAGLSGGGVSGDDHPGRR